MAIDHEDLIGLFSAQNREQIYVLRFTDGRTEELWECQVWGDPKNREFVGTMVRTTPGSLRSAGEAIVFALDDIADAEIRTRLRSLPLTVGDR
jgi:hypothetical protein